jgi:hypothetical protein
MDYTLLKTLAKDDSGLSINLSSILTKPLRKQVVNIIWRCLIVENDKPKQHHQSSSSNNNQNPLTDIGILYTIYKKLRESTDIIITAQNIPSFLPLYDYRRIDDSSCSSSSSNKKKILIHSMEELG